MKRSNTHIIMGLGFVGAAVLAAGSLYVGLKAGASVEQPPAINNEVAAVPENAAISANQADPIAEEETPTAAQPVPQNDEPQLSLRERMVNFYYSEHVDMENRCAGSRWSFEADGTFEIVWTRVNETSRGRWGLVSDALSLKNIETTNNDDQSSKISDDKDEKVRWTNGALVFGPMKLYPCRTAA